MVERINRQADERIYQPKIHAPSEESNQGNPALSFFPF
jgi:hypothetical protein